MLLDLIQEINLIPKRVGSTNGGEYHSPCPACGGNDRFIIWPVTDRYWCRQCNKSGDSIQFCRDFLGMDYSTACRKIGKESRLQHHSRDLRSYQTLFVPKVAEVPPEKWRTCARNFTEQCHQTLMKDLKALNMLLSRGLLVETIREYSLGWWDPGNRNDQFQSLHDWGLPASLNEKGLEKRVWTPRGFIIPTFSKEGLVKLKIRRSEWKEGDKLPKYVEVSGSMKCPSLYGDIDSEAVVILESELDGMIIQQVASDLCCCMAIGGAGKRTDLESDHLLRRAKQILFSLDFDEAGKKAYRFWKSTYSNIIPWPVPRGKSPGAACELGVNLREWVIAGIR